MKLPAKIKIVHDFINDRIRNQGTSQYKSFSFSFSFLVPGYILKSYIIDISFEI
jgi:hypothetical protein